MKLKIKNIHPGEVLQEEFLIPMDISAYRLSKDIDIPQTRISEILKGRRRLTADTCLRLSKYFGNSAQFWMSLQAEFDLEEAKNRLRIPLKRIIQVEGSFKKRKMRTIQTKARIS